MDAIFLARSCPESTQSQHTSLAQYLEIADEELKRVASITQQALGFYREGSAPVPVVIRAVLAEIVNTFRSKIRNKQAQVQTDFTNGDAAIVGIPGELRQVFSNIFANSLDAIGPNGTIKLRIKSHTGRGVQVTIADDGNGIQPASLPRIFEPLFTTKGDLGTGLGLWVTKQLIDKHGGSIRVRSSVSGRHKGTTFSVIMPVIRPELVNAIASR